MSFNENFSNDEHSKFAWSNNYNIGCEYYEPKCFSQETSFNENFNDNNYYDFSYNNDIDCKYYEPVCLKQEKKNKKQKKKKINNNFDLFKDILHYTTDSENENIYSNEEEQKKKEDVCINPLCNHNKGKKIKMPTNIKLEHIDDLINLGKLYHCKNNVEYNGINLRIMCKLVLPLTKLQNMVGMENIKESIVNQIIFFLQGLNQKEKCNNCMDCSCGLPCSINMNNDMLHTVITGPPGVGKTELGKILGEVYKAMGVLSTGHVNVVSRSDLVGKWLGHTAAKTQAVIDKCKGGVMFIDEAYSLGNKEGRDSFSKECLDTLNQNLTERRDFLCIIAGYKDALDECFFSYNEGLKRRFTFRYDITGYNASELKDIFLLKLSQEGWTTEFKVNDNDDSKTIMNKHRLEQDIIRFFQDNLLSFPNYGGDIETFFLNCKISHSKRAVFLNPSKKKVITNEDIKEGFKSFVKARKAVSSQSIDTYYS